MPRMTDPETVAVPPDWLKLEMPLALTPTMRLVVPRVPAEMEYDQELKSPEPVGLPMLIVVDWSEPPDWEIDAELEPAPKLRVEDRWVPEASSMRPSTLAPSDVVPTVPPEMSSVPLEFTVAPPGALPPVATSMVA